MCQILALTTHPADPVERDKLIQRIWSHMWHTGKQNDGCGAAWFTADGRIAYHKSRLDVIHYKNGLKDKINKLTKKGFFDLESLNAAEPSDGGFLIVHARNATCDITVENTHPMLSLDDMGVPQAAMVHNGVVRSFRYPVKHSTCDSEQLLRAYDDGGIKSVERDVFGKYAFMFLKVIDGLKRLHIVKDKAQHLVCGVLNQDQEPQHWAFATTAELVDLVGAKYCGPLKECSHVRFTEGQEGTFEASLFTPNDLYVSDHAFAEALRKARSDKQVIRSDYPPRRLTPSAATVDADARDLALQRAIEDVVTRGSDMIRCAATTDGTALIDRADELAEAWRGYTGD